MGGLDLCYGRWDLNQHPIADAHPENLEDILFPGQDYNNARIMDFQDVPHFENNKLNRLESSRMGWSDISVSLHGPVVRDLKAHFAERWNFIYDEKYDVRKDVRYSRLLREGQPPQPAQQSQESHQQTQSGYQAYSPQGAEQQYSQSGQGSQYQQQSADYGTSNQYGQSGGQYYPPPPSSSRGFDDANNGERGFGGGSRHHHLRRFEEEGEEIKERLEHHMHHMTDHDVLRPSTGPSKGPMSCQIVRSATGWSNGTQTEHSIADAYCDVIRTSQHFVYIENQFFITATGNKQKPIKNQIGAAIVERVVRAARAGEKYKVIIVIPAVPAFAGDLKDDASLGTRAIMEFQYNSINRGGHSIMEEIANAGFNPTDYIRFYNLRNYDRIDTGAAMRRAELDSGVNYETARREHDAMLDPAGVRSQEGGDYQYDRTHQDRYQQYQNSAGGKGQWSSISSCYMLGGCDIREVPFEEGNVDEIDTFVSEELYVHSKVLIADDRRVICGSANLNDRSQLGFHDSEIAIIVDDTQNVDSYMDGRPFQAAKFAATLRRQLFRKHLGLLRPQDPESPNANFEPIGVPNDYDFGSQEDHIVTDPLSDQFLNFWNGRARQNTDAFGRVFHPVPHDDVRTWADYDNFYEKYFKEAEEEEEPAGKKVKKPAKYKWGHVVAEEFSPGPQGAREVKDILASIKGNLVEMPLLFLQKEDIAQEGISLNAFTEEVYT
jgi:phospholipase D1/2